MVAVLAGALALKSALLLTLVWSSGGAGDSTASMGGALGDLFVYALALTLVAALLLEIACERAIAKALVTATTPAKARASRSEGTLLAAQPETAPPRAVDRARARASDRACALAGAHTRDVLVDGDDCVLVHCGRRVGRLH